MSCKVSHWKLTARMMSFRSPGDPSHRALSGQSYPAHTTQSFANGMIMAQNILITGAAGFIGQELTIALLESDPSVHLVLTDTTAPTVPARHAGRCESLQADLTSPDSHKQILPVFTAAYLLHGIMSGGAEANLELGLRVNLDSHRMLLDHIRRTQDPSIKIIFPSSLAVFGHTGPDDVVTERTIPLPQSSYGAEKLMIETLINDFSRRGLIDGRILRLPTVVVRPVLPSSAASSFASGIIRESLKGERNQLPVDPNLAMWICSPQVVIQNLVQARQVPASSFRLSRVVNLPGQTITVKKMLETLEIVGGVQKRALVREQRDEKVAAIVDKWPQQFDTSLASNMGFSSDIDFLDNVRSFLEAMPARS